jgi:hypothetical protein
MEFCLMVHGKSHVNQRHRGVRMTLEAQQMIFRGFALKAKDIYLFTIRD